MEIFRNAADFPAVGVRSHNNVKEAFAVRNVLRFLVRIHLPSFSTSKPYYNRRRQQNDVPRRAKRQGSD